MIYVLLNKWLYRCCLWTAFGVYYDLKIGLSYKIRVRFWWKLR